MILITKMKKMILDLIKNRKTHQRKKKTKWKLRLKIMIQTKRVLIEKNSHNSRLYKNKNNKK